jgi:HD superfamily phosphodiesterase
MAHLEKMKKSLTVSFIEAVEARYPGLIDKIKAMIEESERQFSGGSETAESFLWEHTTHVASLSFELARSEKIDPVIPTVAALFHDAGKFAGGAYHKGGKAEEEAAAAIADGILRQLGMSRIHIHRVVTGLRALYRSRAKPNPISDIVHDADFLSKFGALGVAQFFIKSTLRGQTLQNALTNQLSKELTYAACLPCNMRTRAGKRLAERKSRETLKFFGSLMRELKETHAADFTIKRLRINPSSRPRAFIDVRLAVPRSCSHCGGRWTHALKTEQGIKCEMLEAEITCARCGNKVNFSFCLPEIRSSPRA